MEWKLKLEGSILRKKAHMTTKNGFIFDPDAKIKIQLSDYIAENEVLPETPFKGAIKLTINCYFKLPSSLTSKEKERRLQFKWAPEVRKDCDNIAKLYNDILQYGQLEGKIFIDDHYIVALQINKMYSDCEEFIEIFIQGA